MDTPPGRAECSSSGCCGGPNRREFLQAVGIGAYASLAAGLPAMAGPFGPADFDKLVPSDKKLSPEWVRALFEKGTQTLYRGKELEWIGMPIGGICTGQLYLGGDGRLWHWDIFNQQIGTGDAHYAHPPKPDSPLEQGFALRLRAGDKSQVRTVDRQGFEEVTFCGEYPLGFIEYRDKGCPVAVSLQAFSPFIPLNAEDSNLPATIMEFTLTNSSADKVECGFTGWLENAVSLYTGKPGLGKRQNRIVALPNLTFLECSAASETLKPPAKNLSEQFDFGTLGLALLEPGKDDLASVSLPENKPPAEFLLTESRATTHTESRPFGPKLIGALGRKLTLDPGKQAKITFLIVWNFPNLQLSANPQLRGRHYAERFASSLEVAEYMGKNFASLASQTRLWHDTWYDSTLPHWFLDRTFANTSILATSTCHWLGDGRFYAWEGVGCCQGTCTHVWQYAQAVARIFPQLERNARERVDYGIAFHPDTGSINHRGEWEGPATDGQAGCILRAYREHQMSPDNAFLKRLWPRIKKSLQFLINADGNGDGLIEGAQHNTLDSSWYGPVAWLSSLYLAALRAGEEMAKEMGDEPFANETNAIWKRGKEKIIQELWNGEYFIQKPDPKHPEAMKSGKGCEIDQVFGQSWAFQVGLGRLISEQHVKGALKSLWKYNFTPDVGPYRNVYKNGRWYAMPGEAGLLMCTFPKGGQDEAAGKVNPGFAGYFNECMNGFEYQVAGHMIEEGLLKEGLAVTRAIHDRYQASRRNPWNEVECGDHYARSMASYGVFLAACGYEYHGPKGYLSFNPHLTPEDFRAAFTAAEGWGTFSQKRQGKVQKETLSILWGKVPLRILAFTLSPDHKPTKVTISANNQVLEADNKINDDRLTLSLHQEVVLSKGNQLHVVIE